MKIVWWVRKSTHEIFSGLVHSWRTKFLIVLGLFISGFILIKVLTKVKKLLFLKSLTFICF
jgi:hypothetical protein